MKKELKLFLREMGIKQEELYHLTGYHFEDVEAKEDLEEIKRLINYVCYGK